MFDPNTHVLIVDDMLTVRLMVKKACTGMGFTNFTEAADGQEAWDKLNASETPVGLVICDWNMPNVTGLDFLKMVRADDNFKSLPFMLVTAEAEKEQVVLAVKAGASAYVVKPFTAEILKAKLEKIS